MSYCGARAQDMRETAMIAAKPARRPFSAQVTQRVCMIFELVYNVSVQIMACAFRYTQAMRNLAMARRGDFRCEHSPGADTDKVTFNRDIRPIMSDTCFRCHGPDKGSRMAGLRLDIRDEALKPTRSGKIPIVPGDPDKSEIIERIFATGAKIMPPTFAQQGADGEAEGHHPPLGRAGRGL